MKFYTWTPEHCNRPRLHFRVFHSAPRRKVLTATFGLHWILQLAIYVQHQWARAAHAESLIEKWTIRRAQSSSTPVPRHPQPAIREIIQTNPHAHRAYRVTDGQSMEAIIIALDAAYKHQFKMLMDSELLKPNVIVVNSNDFKKHPFTTP